MKKLLSASVALMLTVGLLAGCGGSKNLGKAVIASSSPLSGGQATLGNEIARGVELAIDAAKEDFAKLGVTLEHLAKDDQAKEDVGSQLAQEVANNSDVLGVVGTLNSGVALAETDTYEASNLVMVSPANTNPSLTQKEDGSRAFKIFHRLVARDDSQGPAGARFAYNQLGARVMYILHDKTQYGQGLAEAFAGEAKNLGANVVAVEGINPEDADFSAVLTTVLASSPDLVYYGGIYDTAGRLFKQAREKGYQGKFMGGDGLDSSTLVELGGEAANGTFFTSVVSEDAYTSAEGKTMADAYKAKFGGTPTGWVAYAYDATNVILAHLKDYVTKNNKLPTRAELTTAVQGTKGLQGLTGDITFDQVGDRVDAKMFIFVIENGQYPGKVAGSV